MTGSQSVVFRNEKFMATSLATIGPRARLAVYAPLLRAAADAEAIDPYLLAALAIHESGGNPYAVRVERSYWVRYREGIIRALLGNLYAPDDRWLQYPDLVSASFGLCQIMYPTAVEAGVRIAYPTELCDPQINLRLGARLLARMLRHAAGDVTTALLSYNGGGDPDYAKRVLSWRRALLEDPEFPRLEYVAPPPPAA